MVVTFDLQFSLLYNKSRFGVNFGGTFPMSTTLLVKQKMAAKPEYSDELPNPQTELGKQLSILRKKIVDSGVRLLTLDEINSELNRDRSGIDSHIS